MDRIDYPSDTANCVKGMLVDTVDIPTRPYEVMEFSHVDMIRRTA